MRQRVKGWPGYVHTKANGEALFIIERQMTIDGKRHRFHLSTGCSTIKPALEQLARFEADPFAFTRAGADVRPPLLLDVDLIERLYDYQIAKGLTPKYARETSTWLLKWLVALRGVDLRRLVLARHVLPVLDGNRARRSMMASFKTLMTWLRVDRHELKTAEDVGQDLSLPQSDPGKRKQNVIHDIAAVRAVLKRLHGVYRDALLFQWATGAHVTDMERFVRESRSRFVEFAKPERLADGTKALAVVSFWHKTSRKMGKLHDVALTRREHVEAARSLRERGSLPTGEDLNSTIYAACEAAGVPRMSFALRHTVLTRAAERNISRDRRMAHAGHKNVDTANRYVHVDMPLAAIPAEKL